MPPRELTSYQKLTKSSRYDYAVRLLKDSGLRVNSKFIVTLGLVRCGWFAWSGANLRGAEMAMRKAYL